MIRCRPPVECGFPVDDRTGDWEADFEFSAILKKLFVTVRPFGLVGYFDLVSCGSWDGLGFGRLLRDARSYQHVQV